MRKSLIFSLILFSAVLYTNCSQSPVNSDDTDMGHAEAEGFIIAQNDVEIVRYENGSVDGEITVKQGEATAQLLVTFLNEEEELFTPDSDHHSLVVEITDTTVAHSIQNPDKNWMFQIQGIKQGETSIILKIFHGDHADFVAQPVPIQVGAN